MARFPGWLKPKETAVTDGRAVIRLRVRTWHPSYWRAVWRWLDGTPRRPIAFIGVLWASWRLRGDLEG